MYEIADIQTIALRKLFTEDVEETARLYNACVSDGVFYLDYSGYARWSGQAVDDLFALASDFFALEDSEKMQVSMQSSQTYFGYKPCGANVVDSDGNRDQNEFLNISKDDILNTGCQQYRSLGYIDNKTARCCRTFVLESHDILVHILSTLSSLLELKHDEKMESFHRREGKSGDHLRLVKYAAHTEEKASIGSVDLTSRVMLIPHTDFGTLTLLFTERPGLQIMDPGSNSWKSVKPKAGHAIVNVGDALAKFTNGLFRSCQHRVIKMSGSDLVRLNANTSASTWSKYSLGYFLRPEDDVTLRRLHSDLIPELTNSDVETHILSKDWVEHRVNASKVSSFGQKTNWADLKGTALIWTQ